MRSPYTEELTAAAWGWRTAPRTWKMALEPPLRIRLSAGLPQILTGDERTRFGELAVSLGWSAGRTAAFPILTEEGLQACLVLLDAPAFDLEDDQLLGLWEILRHHLLQALRGDRGSADLSHTPPGSWLRQVKATMKRLLQLGSRVLLVEYNLELAYDHLESHGFPQLPGPYVATSLRALESLTGNGGLTFMKDERTAFAILPLPARLDPDILLHQISATLAIVPQLPPARLDYRLLPTLAAVDALQSTDFPWKK